MAAAASSSSLSPAAVDDFRVRPRAVGGPSTPIWNGYLGDLDPNRELRGDKWHGTPWELGIAEKMMRDPHVRQSVSIVANPVLAGVYDFAAASRDPLDVEAAEFCRWAFIERSRWKAALRYVITGYMRDGVALLEMTDDTAQVSASRFPLHPGRGLGVVPTGWHDRPAHTITRWQQRKGSPEQLGAVVQTVPGSDEERPGDRIIGSDRLIRWTWEQEGAHFTGFPLLRSAYQPWKLKIAFLIIDAIKHERHGVGTPLLYYPPDAPDEDLEAAEKILAEMRANAKGYMMFGSDYKFEWSTTSSSDGTAIAAAIERCNKDIAHNVAAAFMLLGGGGGSYALAQSQEGQYAIALDAHADFLIEPWNLGADGWSPIERITRMNYGPDVGVPRLYVRNLPTRDWTKVLPALHNLGVSGFITPDEPTESRLREVLRLPERDPSTARRPMQGAAFIGSEQPQQSQPAPGVQL